MAIIRSFGGDFSNEEVFDWLDRVIEDNGHLAARRIRVSNSLYTRGIAGEYKDIPIAMNPDWYPEDKVEVLFDGDTL
ncbi:hypothetical protein [Neorhizobium sp. DAR64861/K0K2]|uniref:hypothetical protein n=1 Tax=unclassified Neorhizobium TaxID=2629175 RepID=UPI003D2B3DD3